MEIQKCIKESFTVIGKEGSTHDGKDFIQRLWRDAESHFSQVADLAKRDEKGNILGFWGLMSDFSRSFRPWEDGFTKGLYLAGVEVIDDSQAPVGWTKWVVPAYEYVYVKHEGPHTFANVIQYLKDNGIALAGAAHDFSCPKDGQGYIFFPIRTLGATCGKD